MNTKSVSAQSATGESDESPFASKGGGKKGGLVFGKVLSQSTRALAGKQIGQNAGQAELGQASKPDGLVGAFARELPPEGVVLPAGKGAVAKAGAGDKTLEGLGRVMADDDGAARKSVRAVGVTKSTLIDKQSDAPATVLTEVTEEGGKSDRAARSEKKLARTDKSDHAPVAAPHVLEKDVRKADVSALAVAAKPDEESPIIGKAKAGEKPAIEKTGIPAKLARAAQALEIEDEASSDAPVKDLTAAPANGKAAKDPNAKETSASAEGQPAHEALEAMLTAARPRLARGAALPGHADGADAAVSVEGKPQAREEGRGRSSDEGKTTSEPNPALIGLQSAGLLDFRMPLLHQGVAGDEESHGAGVGAASGNGDAAAADLAATLRHELDRPSAPNAPTFSLPPPPPVTAAGPNGVGDVAPAIPPGAVLAPPELAMIPEDPALNLAVLTRAAHLSIEGQDGRSLELHVRLMPEGAEIRANGELAPLVQSKASDLSAALAAEGMTLNRFELTQDRRHDGHRDPRAHGDDDGDSYRPVAARRAASHSSTVDTVTRPSDGRIHVKA
ncbi:MAG TPA: hypothetical protein VGG33_21900 [Polyangia bacterium]